MGVPAALRIKATSHRYGLRNELKKRDYSSAGNAITGAVVERAERARESDMALLAQTIHR